MAENSREFPIPGNENYVPESLSLIQALLQDAFKNAISRQITRVYAF